VIIEVFFICITVFLLCAPLAYAKAHEIRERAHRLEAENDAYDDMLMYKTTHEDIGGHE
jgi:hypothetical protein